MLNGKENESIHPAINDVPRISGKLSEIIYSSSAEKRQTILLSTSPEESNQLLAEAIHDLSSWADKPFFVITCQGQAERNTRAAVTYPLHAELPGLFSDPELLEPMRGGTVMVTDPTNLSLQQQKELMKLLQDRLELKVIINLKYLPQYADLPLLHDIKFVKAPTLRNNAIDISFAVNYFLSKANLEWSKNVPGVTDNCLQQLSIYPWPGQLPQLRVLKLPIAIF
jgi:DNA-binding NtrC family response regulator